MGERPSTLFLITAATLFSALLSPFTEQGIPILVLALPIALMGYAMHGREQGVVIGVVASVLTGILVASMGVWDTVAYALSAGITVYAFDTFFPGKKNAFHYLLAAAAGALAFEVLHELAMGNAILLHRDYFLGRNAGAGIRFFFTIVSTGILYEFFGAGDHATPAPAKK